MDEIILNYLILCDVNTQVLSYIEKNKIIIFPIIYNLLGKDFSFFSDKNTIIQKLKNGNENFKILEDGSIWFKITTIPNLNTPESQFYSGNIANKYSNITTKSNITYERGRVVERKVTEKSFHNTYNNQIMETVYGSDFKKVQLKITSWESNMPNEIPNKELVTSIETFNEFGYSFPTVEKINFNTETWNFVFNGEYSVQNESNTIENKKTIFNKLINLKNNLLQKRNQEDSVKR